MSETGKQGNRVIREEEVTHTVTLQTLHYSMKGQKEKTSI